jgi:hypothetical protein
MDHDSDVGKGVGEKRVEGAGRIWRQREGKLSVYGSKSKRVEPDAFVLGDVSSQSHANHIGGCLLCLLYALQQLPQRHLGGTGNLDLVARFAALVEVRFLQLPRYISAQVWCFHPQRS